MLEALPFQGSFVKFTVKNPIRGGLLENVTVQTIGGRAFVVGQLSDVGAIDNVRPGLTYWFPVEDVQMIVEFADRSRAQEYFRQSPHSDTATSTERQTNSLGG